ncbi:phospholipase D family protein [Salinarimonas soli]|uniref:Choline phosphatase n=1 Tax=Salinarimonas soli TaxID=1638099 RepID=A0A5B2VAV9_9HYPH|nr:phospholipase D family protein [Salinarimonas soli]KAA2235570.1 hypothetical protein F0L46_18885 [Salinarimonas soli]
MTIFHSGHELSQEIRRVLGGAHVRCAVAFWGKGTGAFLKSVGADLTDLRIVCNIEMGGTNPDALVELGAPDNSRLRHQQGLHAKVYISDRGLVVGSANVSENGIGLEQDVAGLTEAGVVYGPHEDAWSAAAAWFEQLFERAAQVDADAIATARQRFSRVGPWTKAGPLVPGSLMNMIRMKPELFKNVGFVVASVVSTEARRATALRQAVQANIATKTSLAAIPDDGMFIGWSKADVRRWPATFLEFWIPKSSLRIFPRSVRALDPKNGNVFSVRDARAVRDMLPSGVPSFAEAQRVDRELAQRLREGGGGVFPTAYDLADALEKL